MDPWRRKLDRLNAARRPSWARRPRDPIIARWGKIALAIAAIAAIGLLFQDHSLRLDASEPAAVATTMPADAPSIGPQGNALFQQERYEEALPLLLPAADAGDTDAQCMIGKLLAQGRGGVAKDPIEGTKWLDLCIRAPYETEWNDEEARDLLDHLINTVGWDIVGEGKYRAFQWQQATLNTEFGEPGRASELVLRNLPNMSAEEAFLLGADLNAGKTLPVDFEKALRAFKHASSLGMTEATFNVGLAYYVGKGVKADPREARHWLGQAADAGYARAAALLGVMAVRGHGMEKDVDLALAYLKQAVDLGDPDAAMMREAVAAGEIPQ